MAERRIQKVAFELVSAIKYPQYYRGEKPCVAAAEVPDGHWSSVERSGEDVESQHRGLLRLMAQGELIRNVRLFEAAPVQPKWRLVGDGEPVRGSTAASTEPIGLALNAFSEDDERHWLVQAYLFNLLAHKAQTRADELRRRRIAT